MTCVRGLNLVRVHSGLVHVPNLRVSGWELGGVLLYLTMHHHQNIWERKMPGAAYGN